MLYDLKLELHRSDVQTGRKSKEEGKGNQREGVEEEKGKITYFGVTHE